MHKNIEGAVMAVREAGGAEVKIVMLGYTMPTSDILWRCGNFDKGMAEMG